MVVKYILLILAGASYGLLAAAGVFTVFVAVGLIPRFAGRTETEKYVLLYEEMVILGTIFGCVASVFNEYVRLGVFLQNTFPNLPWLAIACGTAVQFLGGGFGGIFIGCLALAIAEMLDSIPIFTRRISFQVGLAAVVIGMALGKISGSMYYYWARIHRVIE